MGNKQVEEEWIQLRRCPESQLKGVWSQRNREPDGPPEKEGCQSRPGFGFWVPPLPTHSGLCLWQYRGGCRCIGAELLMTECAQTDSQPLFVPEWELGRERILQLNKEKPEGKMIGVSWEGSEGRGYRQYILIWMDSVSVLSVSETLESYHWKLFAFS